MHDYQRIKERIMGGLIPAVPVPRSADGAIHLEAHDRYVRYMAGQQVAGVAVWVHTGRGLHLPHHEREYVLRSWRKQLREEQLVIAGAGARIDPIWPEESRVDRWKESARRMAEEAMRWGADAILVFPPAIFRDLSPEVRDEAIVEYHVSLANEGFPLILFYLYEEAGGIVYTPDVLRRLMELPQTIGIKMACLDSVMTMQDVASLLEREFPDKLFITGEDRMFGYSVMRGAKGALAGLGAAYPNIQTDMIKAYLNGEADRFLELSSRVDGYAEAAFKAPMDKYILRMLWLLVIAEVIPPEAAHDITGYEMSQDEVKSLHEAVLVNRLY
ncbi:dihydrodipicolinate synthase family protein [Paenibacillus tuaregi]|uniref:dihydrodipicolinate synthase family protein n=1 Tax=Paenibacillus tuaregi TaxID=1816681 RepID=UPI000838AD4B|nr:dihydrodipicolinate synthase family protein [Paenibacillus tuaregi]